MIWIATASAVTCVTKFVSSRDASLSEIFPNKSMYQSPLSSVIGLHGVLTVSSLVLETVPQPTAVTLLRYLAPPQETFQ